MPKSFLLCRKYCLPSPPPNPISSWEETEERDMNAIKHNKNAHAILNSLHHESETKGCRIRHCQTQCKIFWRWRQESSTQGRVPLLKKICGARDCYCYRHNAKHSENSLETIQSGLLNSVTAMGGHDRPLYYELRTRVVSPWIFVRC